MNRFTQHEIGQLTEIKAGKTGTGLLIEHDGRVFGKSDTINQIKEDIDNHQKFVIPDDFVVSAVFQKYGIKNANGRIYPENILKREVKKYLENQVANSCSIGALDHPSCQLADTKILSKDGWKNIPEVVVGEEVFTVNVNKQVELKKVKRTIKEQYCGKLIHIKGAYIDIKVTPNHKFPILDKDNEWVGFYTAQEIIDGKIPNQDSCSLFKIKENISNRNIDVLKKVDVEMEAFSLKDVKTNAIDYDGNVYCIEVENHTFYTMCHNGLTLWSGNSSVLSGHDVSHKILDLRWENRTLVGELKLHLSPGFRKYGICSTSGDLAANLILDGIQIGVSSRAVGSVEEKLGVLMVCDDLELIGWDIVCEPSTPGALIKTNASELEPFIEGDTTKSSKNDLSEKLERVRKILI